jgi:CubicO group peptidase (beta-lactamase class C family)
VQTVSGESYGAYVLRHIFTPLDMRHSYVSLAAARDAGLAQGHNLWFGLPLARTAFYRSDFLPAGFLVSGAADMARYLVAQANGGRYGATSVLAPVGVAALHHPEAPEGAPGTDARYGMGWVTSTVGGRSLLWHDGSSFDTHTFMALDPRTRWGVVVLYNGTSTLYELLQNLDAIGWNVLARPTFRTLLKGHCGLPTAGAW